MASVLIKDCLQTFLQFLLILVLRSPVDRSTVLVASMIDTVEDQILFLSCYCVLEKDISAQFSYLWRSCKALLVFNRVFE